MPQWRISKYDPKYRDRDGSYQLDDWIDVSQLGQTVQGVMFSLEQYLAVEARYIDVALSYTYESGSPALTVKCFEPPPEQIEEVYPWLVEFNLLHPMPLVRTLHEGYILSGSEVRLALETLLRGISSFTVECEREFYLEVGWDYYLYIGSLVDCKRSKDIAQERGLFVEVLRPGQFRARYDWPG
jgi:hypothetical protein